MPYKADLVAISSSQTADQEIRHVATTSPTSPQRSRRPRRTSEP